MRVRGFILSLGFVLIAALAYALQAKGKGELVPFTALWSEYSDIAPSLSTDGKFIVFQSDRDDEFRFSIYTSWFTSAGKLSKPDRIILSKHADFEGQPYFMGRDGRIIYTSTGPLNYTLGDAKNAKPDLWLTRWHKGEWAPPKRLTKPVNSEASELTACISANGDGMYFASNRPGGRGGLDIYFTKKVKGNWTKPKNLGPKINTKQHEIFPRIHADEKTLYFSSNRKGGKGGYDVYISRRSKKKWSKPRNAGNLVNTDTHDYMNGIPGSASYILISRGKKNKEKIFKITPTPEMLMPTPMHDYRVIPRDIGTKAPVKAYVKIQNLKTGKVIVDKEYIPPEGGVADRKAVTSKDSYFKQLGLDVFLDKKSRYSFFLEADGYLFVEKTVKLDQIEVKDRTISMFLTPLAKGAKLPLKNIYFHASKPKLKKSSKRYLNPIADYLKAHDRLKVEIQGHTAIGKGSEKRNLQLSRQRATAVIKYLAKRGVKKYRFKAVGYGSSRPVAPNDTKKNRAKNQRVEFVILEIVK